MNQSIKPLVVSLVRFIVFLFVCGSVNTDLKATTSVAFLGISDHCTVDSTTALDRSLSDMTTAFLSQSEHIILVERKEIDKMLSEIALGQTALMADDKHLSKAGKMIGASYIITGRISPLSNKQGNLFLKVIDVNSGGILDSWAEQAKYPDGILTVLTQILFDLKGSLEKISIIENLVDLEVSDPAFNIDIWTDTTSYEIGDLLTIHFKSDQSCYVNIFDITTSGKIYLLFPNRYNPMGFVKAGETFSVPSRKDNFQIRVNGPPGIEKIKVIASLNEGSIVDSFSSSAGEVLREFSEIDNDLTRDLQIISAGPQSGASWSVKTISFTIH